MKPKQLIRVLEKRGCIFKRQTGSHRIFYCKDKQKIIPVPMGKVDFLKRRMKNKKINY